MDLIFNWRIFLTPSIILTARPSSQAATLSFYFYTIVALFILLLLISVFAVRYLFLYQKQKYRHSQEILEIREAFNKTLLESKLQIQEDTLRHISQELHSNAQHQASLININLTEMLEKSSPETKESIYEIKLIAKQLMGDLKALSAGLNTNHIMKIGFSSALENELKRLAKTKKYATHFNKSGKEFPLRADDEIILFRLCQEILNNIVKYAEAKTVTITQDFTGNMLRVEISDDGIGFDVQEAIKNSGEKESTGLMNMHNRAKLIEATLDVKSEPGKGATLTISLPIKNNQS